MSLRSSLVFAAFALSACTTTGSKTTHKDPTLGGETQPKAGQKQEEAALPPPSPTPPVVPETVPQAQPQVQAVPTPNEAEQLAFVKKQSLPSNAFTEEDRQFVKLLPPTPAAGSVAEAALAMGMIRLASNPDAIPPAVQEGDVQKPAAVPKSLEQYCKDAGVNLPDALTENPLLNGFGVAKQVHDALPIGVNSPEFKNEVTLALKKQASLWQEFSNSLNAPGEQPASSAATPAPEEAPPNPAELAGGDAVLAEAQALADRGNYQGAIKKAQAVPESSPMRPMATEKVKEFSNLAVQDLRKKAAMAFQSAMPVTDAKTRAGYLKQAKGYLEDAIKNYPDATQLPTVRDNLRVISRDLEKLESEQGVKPG